MVVNAERNCHLAQIFTIYLSLSILSSLSNSIIPILLLISYQGNRLPPKGNTTAYPIKHSKT